MHLDSDAYARLSWSSALLTDEGFYIHNARNLILFGHARTDEFNNALIMPLLHGVQVLVFSCCGVGTLQARAISVVASLLTLTVFFCALRRAFSARVAWIGLALLGLDPTFTLYNRLALMDTPACLPLCCAFYVWTRFSESVEKRWVFACGLSLAVAYLVRGLAAIIVPVPFLLLLLLRNDEAKRQRVMSLAALAVGLTCILLPYLLLWYLPNHLELVRVNTYYLNHQLKPDSLHHLWQNVQHAFFGDDRGVAPYLFRHSPVTFALTLLWLTTRGEGCKEKEAGRSQSTIGSLQSAISSTLKLQSSAYLTLWLLLTWLLLAVISYAPDRYYVLFYPALCGLAALALCELPQRLSWLWQSRLKRTALGSFLAYHLGEAFLHHQSRVSDLCLYAFTGAVLLTLAILPLNMSQWRNQRKVGADATVNVCLLLWGLVATGWFGDWLLHLEYTQRDADQWLATHLPPNSVLIGDVAPGLCLNNRFRCINVIPGLCNDNQPVEKFATTPCYIVVLDGKFKEPWWRKNYPDLVAPKNLLRLFPRIIRLPVGVYKRTNISIQELSPPH